MSNEHDNDPIPEPDAEPTAAEEKHARSFADLVDDLVDGKAAPPAMPAETRELLTTAGMIHASTTEVSLDDTRRDAIIDRAFAQTLPAELRSVDDPASDSDGNDIPSLTERRNRLHAVPWLVAAVAAAAAVFFALNPPTKKSKTATRVRVQYIEQTPVSAQLRSRPADPLIGRIAPKDSAAASERLDRIFSDRLSGYRDLRLRRRVRTTPGGSK